jgi:phosphoserine phosphatase RsbU/P
MNIAETAYLNQVREQLLVRRQTLESALTHHETAQLLHLVQDVDQALAKLETGNFGVCQNCHESIEVNRILADPLVTFCLGCLTPAQQRALESDLELAARMQTILLPSVKDQMDGWSTAYHFRPARVVSGDYCDLICDGTGGLYFVLADVAGKGVGAAMLTAGLRAVFRALIPTHECVSVLLEKASQLFCDSAMSGQFATLVFGHVTASGEVQYSNAGHLPLLIARESEVEVLESTDVPFGMFCSQTFSVHQTQLRPGDTLVLCSDGISEAENAVGEEFGMQRLRELIRDQGMRDPAEVVDHCRTVLDKFRGDGERLDDETMLAIRFAPAAQINESSHHAYA